MRLGGDGVLRRGEGVATAATLGQRGGLQAPALAELLAMPALQQLRVHCRMVGRASAEHLGRSENRKAVFGDQHAVVPHHVAFRDTEQIAHTTAQVATLIDELFAVEANQPLGEARDGALADAAHFGRVGVAFGFGE